MTKKKEIFNLKIEIFMWLGHNILTTINIKYGKKMKMCGILVKQGGNIEKKIEFGSCSLIGHINEYFEKLKDNILKMSKFLRNLV